jgi:methionyl-tRNA formyltransferase
MTQKNLKIVFMGTPYFAVPSLDKIVQSQHKVLAVVTAPDKPAGRGMKLQTTAVKDYAIQHQIPVLQPEKLRNEEFLNQLRNLNADLFVIVAFRMLPEVVWSMPPMGSINLHGSLLPKYRGAAPINWAVINGEKETGVTTFFLQHEIDTGKIIEQKSFPITETDTAGQVHDTMMNIGAEVLLNTINNIANANILPKDQKFQEDLPHAPKLNKDTGKIDWSESVQKVYNLIRGLSPAPAAFTNLDAKKLKIYKAQKVVCKHDRTPAIIETDNKKFINIYTPDGYLSITELQLEGKKRMTVEEFLRGNTIKDSLILA